MDHAARFENVGGLVFDLFGTLTDSSVEREREALYRQLARSLKVPEERFVQLRRETFDQRCVGAFGDVRQTLARLCGMLGQTPDDATLDAAVELRLAIERRLAEPRIDAVPVLRCLRDRQLPVAVVSDCGPATPAVWSSLAFAELVDEPVFSCDLGVRKPHPALYERAAAGLGLPPAVCLYVGDGGSHELSGALAAGLRAVRLSPPAEGGEADLRFDPDHDFRGPSVESLSALLAGLAAPERP